MNRKAAKAQRERKEAFFIWMLCVCFAPLRLCGKGLL
jgi:hypothetical protein